MAITETTGGTSTKTGYLWCGESICSAYGSGGTTLATYLPEGEIHYSGGTATDYYYETDHLGTVTSVTSATGTVLGTLATDAYVNTLSSSGTLPTFGYAGMFLHQPSGLYLTKYRAYDPYSGRWLSRDPMGEYGGINLYGYVDEDPVDATDPNGRWLFVITGLVGAAGGAGGDFIVQYIRNGGNLNCVNWGQVGEAAVFGGIAGAAAPWVATDYAGAALLGAVTNGAQYIYDNGTNSTVGGALAAEGEGAVGGLVGGPVGNPFMFFTPNGLSGSWTAAAANSTPSSIARGVASGATTSAAGGSSSSSNCGCH